MQAARVTPFPFGDFAEPAPAKPQAAPTPDGGAERLEAYEEGFAAAKASIDAHEAASIAAIADALSEERTRFAEGLATEAQALRDAARAFLNAFAGRLASTREVELAASLVDRLLAACAERTPARLEVSARSFGRLHERLHAELADRNAADFVDLAPAADLAPGDCRLIWRGGGATRRLADAFAQLEEAFGAPADETRTVPTDTEDMP
ncbi:MAG: hypothetical protein RIE56_03880 [Amphiplicatus sp.]